MLRTSIGRRFSLQLPEECRALQVTITCKRCIRFPSIKQKLSARHDRIFLLNFVGSCDPENVVTPANLLISDIYKIASKNEQVPYQDLSQASIALSVKELLGFSELKVHIQICADKATFVFLTIPLQPY